MSSDSQQKQRILIAAHYLPFQCRQKNGQQVSITNAKPSINRTGETQWEFPLRDDHSALYAGVLSLADTYECVFVGSVDKIQSLPLVSGPSLNASTGPSDSAAMPPQPMALDTWLLSELDKERLADDLWSNPSLLPYRCAPVFIDPDCHHAFYEGYCKTVLWSLFHYILWRPTDGRKESEFWSAYQRVNQLFAAEIIKHYRPGDIIWIHDYHLLLLPYYLRKTLRSATIGMFVHTPFPSSELFRCLPQRKQVLESLLRSNLVGFQTYSYARHFISSCTRILGVESTPKGIDFKGNNVIVGTFPIGIDVEQVSKSCRSQKVMQRIAAIRELYAGKKIIVGRDKLDEIKGVHHKLCAFEQFLSDFPEWQDQCVLIQVTSPTDLPGRLESKVSEMVARINGHYGSLDFAPVHHYHHRIDRSEYYALLTVADVALITSVRDGMNTTSHEYVVCQKDQNHGPLILSEFTGTAGSLSAAILVNPWDYKGVASAIHEALTLSKDDKSIKHSLLYNYVTSNTAAFWARSFLSELTETSGRPAESNPTPFLDYKAVGQSFQRARTRILFLDYDGTLTPIRKTPNAAVPSERMMNALSRLAADESTFVYVVSGRDQKTLDNWLGHIKHLGMSAEHGCFLKYTDHSDWYNLLEEIDLGWKNDVLPIFEYFTERTPGSFIEEKQSSLTWHYRLADPDYGYWQAKECYNHLENTILSKLPVEILMGKKNLEIRPQQINKGEVIKRLMDHHLKLQLSKSAAVSSSPAVEGGVNYGSSSPPGNYPADIEFVFCAGDDKTDEDMFRALRRPLASPIHSPGSPLPNGNGATISISSWKDQSTNGNNRRLRRQSADIASLSGEQDGRAVFTCTIGSATKKTMAIAHVNKSEELIDLLEELANTLKHCPYP